MSLKHRYTKLKSTNSEDEEDQQVRSCQQCAFKKVMIHCILFALIVVSFTNGFVVYHYGYRQANQVVRSEYGILHQLVFIASHVDVLIAELSREIPVAFQRDGHENTSPEWLWNTPDLNVGMIALTDEYSKSKHLPRAQRYPWDYNKGLYYIHGYHNLHCLVMLLSVCLSLS